MYALNIVLATLGAVLALLGIAFLSDLFGLRSRLKSVPAHWIVSPTAIRDLLNKAIEQRSKFEMKFLPVEPGRPHTYCFLDSIEATSLVFELPAHVQPSKRWIDRPVDFIFKLSDDKLSFFRFPAAIVGARRSESRLPTLQVVFPEKLEMQQNRGVMRIEPPLEYLRSCQLWQRAEIIAQPREWGSPALAYDAPEGESTCKNGLGVENVSAGGIRLQLRRYKEAAGFEVPNIASHLYLFLELLDPDLGQAQLHWLECRVQNIYEDETSKELELGLQFLRTGQPATSGGETLEWTNIGKDGVEPLANWVIKRHLELYRTHSAK